MSKRATLVLGLALGAGLMLLLDEQRVMRLREILRSRTAQTPDHASEPGGRGIPSLRSLRRQARATSSPPSSEIEVDDAVLEARVREALARFVADPTGVRIRAEHGRVTLHGRALEEEMNALVEGVHNVPGVHDVINRMESTEAAG
jgi:hypothetical protein